MGSLASIMDTSLSAMFAARAAIQTVGHNIANVNTPGFSRQEVLLGARRPDVLSIGVLGRGVDVTGIRRLTDDFLLANHRTQSARLASYTQVDLTLQEIEGVFGSVDNDHLGDAITNFFNAWSDLATPPANPAMKQAVLSAAQNMVADFHAVDNSLTDLDNSLISTVEREVANLNDLLAEVADLNGQIQVTGAGNAAANDLLDRRDYVLGEISKLAKVDTLPRTNGVVDVILAGRTVVSRDNVLPLAVDRTVLAEGGSEVSIVIGESRSRVDLPDGKLAGLIISREEQVRFARQELDAIAGLIAEKVNELHVQGRSGDSGGLAFFTGDSAQDLAINPAILDDYNRIVTSRSGADGDNDIALEIAALLNTPVEGGSGLSISDSYRTVIIQVAAQRSRYEFLVENQDNMVVAVEARLEAVRGVSLDEEGANLIKFQNSYDAAARVITTVQDLFDTLLNLT